MIQINHEAQTDKVHQLLLALGKAYLERKEYTFAFEKFQQLLELGAESPEVVLCAATAKIYLNDVSHSALLLYEKAISVNPDSQSLRQKLAEMFIQFDVTTTFAFEILDSVSQPEVPGADLQNSLTEIAPDQENQPRVEDLWWDGRFDQALNLLQAVEHSSHDAAAVDLALTHAYQAISKGHVIEDESNAAVIFNGLEVINPTESLNSLRNYLTLRMAMPELGQQDKTAPDDSDEYEFILGLVTMEDFFSRLKNGAAGHGVILSRFDLRKEILEVLPPLDGASSGSGKQKRPLQSIVVAEIHTEYGVPEELIPMLRGFASKIRNGVIRMTGGGFVSLAPDFIGHVTAVIELFKSVVLFNRTVSDSQQLALICGMTGSSTNDGEHVLRALVEAAHLSRLASQENALPASRSSVLLVNDDIIPKFFGSEISFTRITGAQILPGHTSACNSAVWYDPVDYLDDGHPFKLADFLIEKRVTQHVGYATFIGVDRRLSRKLIFKIMPPQMALRLHDHKRKDTLFEALRSVGRLSHPNIANLFDLGEQDQMIYFIREFIEGKTIDKLEFSPDEIENQVTAIALKIVRALIFARGQGVLHLNLKPDNVWVNDARVPKVTDFFCGEFATRNDEHAAIYMSPEIAAGEAGDERSDVYSLGMIIHEIFLNRLSKSDTIRNDWNELTEKATQPDATQRYQTLNALEMELRSIQIKLMETQQTPASV
jgi:serine/threonine protein kinase/tetratricopeptide (TPR) repeat protein